MNVIINNITRAGFDKLHRIYVDIMRFSGVLLFMIFIMLLIWVGVILSSTDTLPIKQVRIEGDFTHLSPVDLQLLVTDRVRNGFFNLDIDAVRLALLDEPWISDVSVKRFWPSALRIVVTEQVPVVRWGERGLLNMDGEYFSPDTEKIPLDLPRLNGPDGSELKLLRRFRFMQKQLEAVGLDIEVVNLDGRQSWSFTLTNGVTVMLGRHDFTQRFNRFLTLIQAMLSGRIEKFEAVDMRYTNGFSIKKKQPLKTFYNATNKWIQHG